MIRILQVVNAPDRGGAETMVMNLYRKINREEIQFDFTNHNGQPGAYDEEIKSLGGEVLYLPKFKGYNYSQYISAWKRLFAQHPEYKIVHIHNYNIAGIVANVAAKMGVKVRITHSHSTRLNMSFLKRRVFYLFYSSMLKNSTHFFACGFDAGKFLFKEKQFTILPNAIDTSLFKFRSDWRDRFRKELNIGDDITVLGHVGSFRKPKNHSFLIDLFCEYNKINKDSILVLIGSGENIEIIREKVKSMGLMEKVRFLGQQSFVNQWLSAFDIFVLPSLWEGLPVSVVEAQCSGLPCVISDVIDRGVDITGNVKFVSTNESAVFWADIISSVNSTNRIEMGDIIANSPYNIDKAVSELANFYKKYFQE